MGPIFSLGELADMVRRRALLILTVIVLGCSASVMLALRQAHEYQATEVLQIAQPVIADDLAKSTVEGSSARRLQLIQQRLMARGSVLEVIDKFQLYSDLPGLKDSEKVDMLRRAVQIEGVAAAREGYSDDGTISVLTISARMPTPELAQQIAHDFGQRTIELSKQNRIEQASETLAFFDAQEAAISKEISDLENEITEYRNTNDLSLPGSLEFRREEISTINDGLLDIARERIEVERSMELAEKSQRPATAERLRADYLEQLETLDAQHNLLMARKIELEELIETSPEVQRKLGAYERQVEQLRDELSNIATRRTDAELGFRLEAERQAERLTVIEEAALPDFPISESRKKKAILGGAASVVAAFVLAYLLELKNPVMRSAGQMERELGFAPVVTVPFLDTQDKPRSIWSRLFSLFGGTSKKDKAV